MASGASEAAFADTRFVDGVVFFDHVPFFPFGVYDPGGDYQGVVRHGMNCFLASANPDDMEFNRDLLDAAAAHGLKVNLYLGYDHVKHKEATDRIVRGFRDHPAVLAWFVGDDMTIHSLPRAKEMAVQIRTLDHAHPVVGDVAHTAETPLEAWVKFKPHLDVMMQYDYPVGMGDAPHWRSFNDHRGLLSFCESTLGPVWTFTQAFTWISTLQQLQLPAPDDMESPYPEPSQLRLLTFMEIALGEKGIIYFGPWSRIRKNPATSSEIMLLARELSPCFPLFSLGKRVSALTTSVDHVRACSWDMDGEFAVLLYRDKPRFARYVDTEVVENILVDLPLPDDAKLAAVSLGVRPGTIELVREDGRWRLRIERVELTAAVLLLRDREKAMDIRKSQEELSAADGEECIRAAQYQLNKVRTTYEQCALPVREAEQLFKEADAQIDAVKRLLKERQFQDIVVTRRAVNRTCRRAVELVMDHAEAFDPVPDAVRSCVGLYYGLPSLSAATHGEASKQE